MVAGLHQRPEYNAEHDSNEPKLALHPEDIWPAGKDIETLQAELTPLFSTNFTREQWLIGMPDGSQVEVAFDQGYVESGDLQEPICEVELNLNLVKRMRYLHCLANSANKVACVWVI